MAKRGRPVKGVQLLEELEGSQAARQRLLTILQTMAGAMSVAEACSALGINRSRFHTLRRQFLGLAAGLLEPQPRGRRRQEPTEAQLQVQQLQQEIARLKLDLKATQIREEIALVMPHLLKSKSRRVGTLKKNRRPARPIATPAGFTALPK